MSDKFPSPPPLATAETIGSESGFQVEFRDGYYYIAAVPPGCKDLKVGDRVLEINGVQAFNFGSVQSANELFDTVCMVFLPKEELIRKRNGKTLSDEETSSRRGRRSMYEEEARRAGAIRMSARNLEETLRKEKEDEAALRKMEREIRQLQRADRERRADKERRRSRVLEMALPNGGLNGAVANGTGQRPSILFSPPQTSNKRTLRSSIMESITRSPSTSDRKVRSSVIETGKKSPSTSDRKKSQIRNNVGISPKSVTTEQPKKPKEPKTLKESKTLKEPKTKEKKPASVAPVSSNSESSTSEPPKKTKQQKRKEARSLSPATSEASPPPPEFEVPKKSKPREPMSPNANSGAPVMPIRRSSVMVERKVRELEAAARGRNGGSLSPAPLSPELTLKPKVKATVGKLSKGGSKKWSKSSPKD